MFVDTSINDYTIGNAAFPAGCAGGEFGLELTPPFDSLGECVSTLIDENCSGLKGQDRAACNHDQQDFCFELFGVGMP